MHKFSVIVAVFSIVLPIMFVINYTMIWGIEIDSESNYTNTIQTNSDIPASRSLLPSDVSELTKSTPLYQIVQYVIAKNYTSSPDSVTGQSQP